MCRMAEALAASGNYEVYYSDYQNGLSDNIISDLSVHKYMIPDNGLNVPGKLKIFIEEPVILITPVYWAHRLPVLHPDSQIIFINWHNECIPVLKREWYTSDDNFRKFLKLLGETDCVGFADKTHWMAQSDWGVKIREQYVPLTVPRRESIAKRGLVDNSRINIAILGRLSLDKAYAVADLLVNLSGIDERKPIYIHLIGEGSGEDEVFKRNYRKNIHIVRYGTLNMSEVLNVLAKKVDLLFAMGTSVLDGGSIGLPSFIMPNEIHPFHCDKYVLLSQTVGYAMGWSVGQLERLSIEYYTCAQIIRMIYSDGRKAELGKECYEYCLKNHTDNFGQINSLIENSSLTYRYLLPHLTVRMTMAERIRKFGERLRIIIGEPVKSYKLCGIQVLTVTRRLSGACYIFFFFLPLFRVKEKWQNIYTIQPLLLVWFIKVLRHLWSAAKSVKMRFRG